MAGFSMHRWEGLERWSPTLFLAAGGAWIIDTAPYALELFIDVAIPEALNGALILVAFILTLTGAIVLYPPIADESPMLALAGALVIAVSALVVIGTFAWVVGAGLLGVSMPPISLLVLIIALNLLALVLFGVASARTATPSRAFGGLLISLAVTWTVWIAGIVGLLSSAPEWASAVLGMLFAAISLSIGAILHIGGVPQSRPATASSPATK